MVLERFRELPYIGLLEHRDVAAGDVMNLQSAIRQGFPPQGRVAANANRFLDVRSPHQRDVPWVELDDVTL